MFSEQVRWIDKITKLRYIKTFIRKEEKIFEKAARGIAECKLN